MNDKINPLTIASMMALPYINVHISPPRIKHDRYAPCRCGSGKKYKWCCEKRGKQ